jgi:hypothetical protein
VPVDPELPLPDEPDIPLDDEPVPDDAASVAMGLKGLVKPLTSGCVIAVGLMPKAATGV